MSRSRETARRNASPATFRSTRLKDEPVNSEALECIELFASLLARYQFPRELAVEHFADCMRRLPSGLSEYPADEDDFAGDIYLPGEVLTRWFGLREFVGSDGQPKALRLRGTGLTFTSLVHRIDPNTDPQQVLTYLTKIRAVACSGNRYFPLARTAIHKMKTRTLRTFNFKATLALLRAAERNVREGRSLEYQTTTYGSIPEKSVAEFRQAMRKLADATLISADEAMLRETNASAAGARAIPMMFGAYSSETRPLPSLLAKRTTASKPKKARRQDRKTI